MEFTPAEIAEFRTESLELLEQAEQSLIALDRGGVFAQHYDAIFRAFHSIKGAAGMMEIKPLQAHMHQLENILVQQKASDTLGKPHIDLFLRGLDGCRQIMDGQTITFVYDLPTEAPTPAPAPALVSTRGRLVIVDDEPDVLELLTDILKMEGYEVFGTTKPAEVAGLVERHAPDTVLSDMSMPGMTGLDVLAAVKKVNADLPVIFVSAHLSKEVLVNAIELGVSGVIEKPFDTERVTEAVRSSVGRFQVMQLFNKSLNLLVYQFSDLAEFLTAHDREDVRQTLTREITELVHRRRMLRSFKRAA